MFQQDPLLLGVVMRRAMKKKKNSDRLRPAERLGTLGSVEHSMLQVIQLTLFQTLTLLATPASCSWTLQPVFIRASETTVHQAVLGL